VVEILDGDVVLVVVEIGLLSSFAAVAGAAVKVT
jgi:hypothetical protein